MTALTLVIIAGALYIPGFYIFGIVTACVPIACLTLRRNPVTAGIAVLACALLSIFITRSVAGAIELSVMMVLPGFAAGICFSKRTNFFIALFSACLAVILGMVFAIFMLNLATDGSGIQGMLDEAISVTEQTLQSVLSNAYRGAQNVSQEELASAVSEITTRAKEMILLYFPSALLILSLVIGYLQTRLCIFVIKRTRSGFVQALPFSRMKAPKSMCYMCAALFLVSLFMTRASAVNAAFLNVNAVLYFILGVCGFSFIDFKVTHKIPGGIYRVMIYAGVFMLGGMLIGVLFNALILLGMMDSIVDFRKLGKAGKDYAGKE